MSESIAARMPAADRASVKSPQVGELVSLLGAPPDQVLIARVFRVLKSCLHVPAVKNSGIAAQKIAELVTSVADELEESQKYEHEVLISGRRSAFPVWSVLSRLDLTQCKPAQDLVAAELVLASAHRRPFRKAVATRIKKALDCGAESRAENEMKLGLYAASLQEEVKRLEVAQLSGVPSSALLINSKITAALVTETKCKDPALREIASDGRMLHLDEAKAAALALKRRAEAGDIEAAAVAIAFSLGMPWDTALDVPFASPRLSSWVATIDVANGWNHIDLTNVLPGLAKPIAGHRPASQVIARPNAAIFAKVLRKACARAPEATCLRDLIQQPRTSRDSVPGMPEQGPRKISIARFIASRGMLAVAAGIDRTVAAYTTGAYSLIGKARHYYITIEPAEIWAASCTLFVNLGWGEAVEGAQIVPVGIGSSVTPTVGLVRQIDEHWQEQVASSRVGRRYALTPLVNFHNCFAAFCCHRAVFFTAARAAEDYSFLAKHWRPSSCAFGVLVDKRVGPWHGATPLPIPMGLDLQIKFWLAHLVALDLRLEKLGIDKINPARRHVAAVLSGEAVGLYFRIQPNMSVKVVGSRDLFGTLPEGISVKGDVYRHFVSNAIRALGVPTAYVDALNRHTVQGHSVNRIGSDVSAIKWMSACSAGIDQLAVNVGFTPLPGLNKRIER